MEVIFCVIFRNFSYQYLRLNCLSFSPSSGKFFAGGTITEYTGKVVDVYSPILDSIDGGKNKHIIGKLAQMNADDSLEALGHAKAAWKYGQGVSK